MSTTTVGTSSTTTATQVSSVQVQGDNSFAIYFNQGTTIDGNINLGGTVAMAPSKNSSAAGATLIELDGNLQGDLVLDNTAKPQNVGPQARGIVILGPISPAWTMPASAIPAPAPRTAVVGGTTLGNVGAFVNGGAITVVGTATPSTKGGNPEGGSAVIIANSIAGGFLNNGPATANGSTGSATITGNGATVDGVAYPAMLIDPSQTITATNATIRGPVDPGRGPPCDVDGVDGTTSIQSRLWFHQPRHHPGHGGKHRMSIPPP